MSELDGHAVERVLIDSWLPTPDAELIDRPDWAQISTPSIPDFTANGVYRAKLAPDEADARIADVIAAHVARGAQFRWFVGPSSEPADLADRLARAGLLRLSTAYGMSMAVPEQPPEMLGGFEVRAVENLDDIDAYVAVSLEAWQREPAYGEAMRRVLLRALDQRDILPQWIVWHEGEPIGVTAMRLLPASRIGYFQGGAVIPRKRGVGAYKASLAERLKLLRERGYAHAVTWAHADTSAPILRRAGFGTRCEGVFLEWRGAP